MERMSLGIYFCFSVTFPLHANAPQQLSIPYLHTNIEIFGWIFLGLLEKLIFISQIVL